jgi:hypothetical protein
VRSCPGLFVLRQDDAVAALVEVLGLLDDLTIGRGLDLLQNPELVKDPKIAYALMAHGMRTGFGFANKHSFSEFFAGKKRDYKHARKMVNKMDHAEDIAKLAEAMEDVLLEARTYGPPVSPPISNDIEGYRSR